jgi:hypothetical protein
LVKESYHPKEIPFLLLPPVSLALFAFNFVQSNIKMGIVVDFQYGL